MARQVRQQQETPSSQPKQLFVVTVFYDTEHRDASNILLITTDLKEAFEAISRAPSFGYRFHNPGFHGACISLLDVGTVYERPQHASPPDSLDHPGIIFFRWRRNRFAGEWDPERLEKLGIKFPGRFKKNIFPKR